MLTYNRNDNDIVLCRNFVNLPEAHLAESALVQEGIECFLENAIFGSIYPMGFSDLGAIRLMVKQRDLQRALDIINSLHLDGM